MATPQYADPAAAMAWQPAPYQSTSTATFDWGHQQQPYPHPIHAQQHYLMQDAELYQQQYSNSNSQMMEQQRQQQQQPFMSTPAARPVAGGSGTASSSRLPSRSLERQIGRTASRNRLTASTSASVSGAPSPYSDSSPDKQRSHSSSPTEEQQAQRAGEEGDDDGDDREGSVSVEGNELGSVSDIEAKPYKCPSTGDLIYPCPLCEKEYGGKHGRSIWRRHLSNKHDIPLNVQPRRTRWDNDTNRPKDEGERHKRTLESKRRWAAKNRAEKRKIKEAEREGHLSAMRRMNRLQDEQVQRQVLESQKRYLAQQHQQAQMQHMEAMQQQQQQQGGWAVFNDANAHPQSRENMMAQLEAQRQHVMKIGAMQHPQYYTHPPQPQPQQQHPFTPSMAFSPAQSPATTNSEFIPYNRPPVRMPEHLQVQQAAHDAHAEKKRKLSTSTSATSSSDGLSVRQRAPLQARDPNSLMLPPQHAPGMQRAQSSPATFPQGNGENNVYYQQMSPQLAQQQHHLSPQPGAHQLSVSPQLSQHSQFDNRHLSVSPGSYTSDAQQQQMSPMYMQDQLQYQQQMAMQQAQAPQAYMQIYNQQHPQETAQVEQAEAPEQTYYATYSHPQAQQPQQQLPQQDVQSRHPSISPNPGHTPTMQPSFYVTYPPNADISAQHARNVPVQAQRRQSLLDQTAQRMPLQPVHPASSGLQARVRPPQQLLQPHAQTLQEKKPEESALSAPASSLPAQPNSSSEEQTMPDLQASVSICLNGEEAGASVIEADGQEMPQKPPFSRQNSKAEAAMQLLALKTSSSSPPVSPVTLSAAQTLKPSHAEGRKAGQAETRVGDVSLADSGYGGLESEQGVGSEESDESRASEKILDGSSNMAAPTASDTNEPQKGKKRSHEGAAKTTATPKRLMSLSPTSSPMGIDFLATVGTGTVDDSNIFATSTPQVSHQRKSKRAASVPSAGKHARGDKPQPISLESSPVFEKLVNDGDMGKIRNNAKEDEDEEDDEVDENDDDVPMLIQRQRQSSGKKGHVLTSSPPANGTRDRASSSSAGTFSSLATPYLPFSRTKDVNNLAPVNSPSQEPSKKRLPSISLTARPTPSRQALAMLRTPGELTPIRHHQHRRGHSRNGSFKGTPNIFSVHDASRPSAGLGLLSSPGNGFSALSSPEHAGLSRSLGLVPESMQTIHSSNSNNPFDLDLFSEKYGGGHMAYAEQVFGGATSTNGSAHKAGLRESFLPGSDSS